MYQKVNIRQLPASGDGPRSTTHGSRFTIHDSPSFRSLSPESCPERSRRVPAFLTTDHSSLTTGFPAFLTTNHYPLTTAFTPPPTLRTPPCISTPPPGPFTPPPPPASPFHAFLFPVLCSLISVFDPPPHACL
jgi:hypothetical protein